MLTFALCEYPAKGVDDLRNSWLDPPDLIRIEPEVVPGYPDRILPKDAVAAAMLRERTLRPGRKSRQPHSTGALLILHGAIMVSRVGSEAPMTVAELIFEEVKKLPEQDAREVLDFVGYIRERSERTDWHDLMNAQSKSLAPVWGGAEDDIWNNV